MCHPSLIFKIKQIKMKSLLVRPSPFAETQHMGNFLYDNKEKKLIFQSDFSKCMSHTRERHADLNWQVASVPGGDMTSPQSDKAHMGSDLTLAEEQTCKHVCSCCSLTLLASPPGILNFFVLTFLYG